MSEKHRLRKQQLLCFMLLAFIYIKISFCPAIGLAKTRQITYEEQRIEDLTTEILHKEIDLERFYLQYRILGTKEPRYRRLRYFLMQVASASCTLGSNIKFTQLAKQGLKAPGVTAFGLGDADPDGDTTDTTQSREASPGASEQQTLDWQGANLKSSASQSGQASMQTAASSKLEADTTNVLRQSIILGMVGILLDAGSSVVELSSNAYTALHNQKTGCSPAAAIRTVVARIKEIDQLSKERDSIIESNPALPAIAINKAESRVLKSFRDWCLSEFADIYADVKSTQSSSNVYYVLDIVSDSLYLASALIGIKSLTPGKANLGGPAINTAIVGDCFGIISAPASTIAGNRLWTYWRNKLKSKLKEELNDKQDEFKEAMFKLERELASSDISVLAATASVNNRVSAYLLWSARSDRYIDQQLTESRHQSRVALQGELSGPFISGTYLAQDILANIAFYRYPNNIRRGSSLAYAGSIGSVAGSGTSLALTNWNLLSELIHRRKLHKQNALPEDLLDERLRTLNALDALIMQR